MRRSKNKPQRLSAYIPVQYRPSVFRGKINKTIAASDDFKALEHSVFGYFAKNPIGTLLGILLFFLMLAYFGSDAGPFNPTKGSATDIQNEFLIFYNNSNWLLTLTFALLPVLIAYAFMTGDLSIPRRKNSMEELGQMEEDSEGEGPETFKDGATDFDGT